MRILNVDNQEVQNPDLTKGYLKKETIVLVHHPEIKEQQPTYEVVEIQPGLSERRIKTPWIPAKGAWDETEEIERYIEYTPEELAEQERQRQEAEAEEERLKQEAAAEEERRQQEIEEANRLAEERAAEEAKIKEAINVLIPTQINNIEEGIAEVGVIAADAITSIDELMEAVAEIGVMVAEISEQ